MKIDSEDLSLIQKIILHFGLPSVILLAPFYQRLTSSAIQFYQKQLIRIAQTIEHVSMGLIFDELDFFDKAVPNWKQNRGNFKMVREVELCEKKYVRYVHGISLIVKKAKSIKELAQSVDQQVTKESEESNYSSQMENVQRQFIKIKQEINEAVKNRQDKNKLNVLQKNYVTYLRKQYLLNVQGIEQILTKYYKNKPILKGNSYIQSQSSYDNVFEQSSFLNFIQQKPQEIEQHQDTQKTKNIQYFRESDQKKILSKSNQLSICSDKAKTIKISHEPSKKKNIFYFERKESKQQNDSEKSFEIQKQTLKSQPSNNQIASLFCPQYAVPLCCRQYFYQNQFLPNAKQEFQSFLSRFDVQNHQCEQLLKIQVCSMLNHQGGIIFLGAILQNNNYVCKGFNFTEQEKQDFFCLLRKILWEIQPQIITHKLYDVEFVPIKKQDQNNQFLGAEVYLSGHYVIRIRVKPGKFQEIYSFKKKSIEFFCLRNDKGAIVIEGRRILDELKRRSTGSQKGKYPFHKGLCKKPQKGNPVYAKKAFKIVQKNKIQENNNKKNNDRNQRSHSPISKVKTFDMPQKIKQFTLYDITNAFMLRNVPFSIIYQTFQNHGFILKNCPLVEIVQLEHNLTFIKNINQKNIKACRQIIRTIRINYQSRFPSICNFPVSKFLKIKWNYIPICESLQLQKKYECFSSYNQKNNLIYEFIDLYQATQAYCELYYTWRIDSRFVLDAFH